MQNGQLRTSCFPGLSTSSGSNSSSTSTSQDLSTSSAQEHSDELAPRESSGSPSTTQNKNKKRDDSRDADDRLRYLPEWLEEFHRKSRRCRRARTRTHFARLRFGTSCQSGTQEEQYFYSLPKSSKLRSMLANQDDKGSLQKTHWRSFTSSINVWWLDNSWSQSPEWGVWITKQSPVRFRCSRSCHSMDSILSVQNKNFTGDGKELKKVSRAVTKAESSLYGQFIGTRQILWRFIVESSHVNASSIQDEWHCWKSRSIATIGIRWKMVGWFFGMLLLFAKCPRPRGRWEDSLWKTFWRSIQRTNNSFSSNGRISPDFTTRSVRTSSTWQGSSIWDLSWVWA